MPYQREMEHHFGCSFAHVKAYVDPGKTEAMNAHAFTFGTDITFATPSPDRAIVMHELTHVVQQTTGQQGSVAADESEAESVQRGEAPKQAAAPGAATSAKVRKDKEKPKPGELLTATQIKSAVPSTTRSGRIRIARSCSRTSDPGRRERSSKSVGGGGP